MPQLGRSYLFNRLLLKALPGFISYSRGKVMITLLHYQWISVKVKVGDVFVNSYTLLVPFACL